MTDKTLYLLRSVSGAGKTTLAKTLEASLPNAKAIAADDFWYLEGDGGYAFDITRLGEAHSWCKNYCERLMKNGRLNIIVHNTNTSEKEIKPYMNLAEVYSYKFVSLVVENRHGSSNVHNVPDFALERQESNLRNNLKLK